MKRATAEAEPTWRHEATRRPFVRIALAFAVVGAILGLAHAGLSLWVHEHAGGPPPDRIAPPPVLPAPVEPKDAPAYRWVDRDRGIAEIPIERAMRLLAADGGDRGGIASTEAPTRGRAVPTAAHGDASLAPGAAVGFDPHLGAQLAIDARVVTESGEPVALGSLLGGPSLVVPVYYRCPNLCDLTLDGVAELVAAMPAAARPTDVVILSFADDETSADARAMRAMLAKRHSEVAANAHWHFLTAAPEEIARATQSIGFRFERDPKSGMYSHVAGLVAAAADGKLLGFLPGVRFDAAKLAAILAGKPAGAAAAPRDRARPPPLLLWCFSYDPTTGRYTLAILSVLKVLGVLCMAAIVAGILAMNRKRARRHAD